MVHAPGADDQRPVLLRAHQQEPDAGVIAQRRDEPWVERMDSLQRHAPRLARERDEPQAARGHHHHLG